MDCFTLPSRDISRYTVYRNATMKDDTETSTALDRFIRYRDDSTTASSGSYLAYIKSKYGSSSNQINSGITDSSNQQQQQHQCSIIDHKEMIERWKVDYELSQAMSIDTMASTIIDDGRNADSDNDGDAIESISINKHNTFCGAGLNDGSMSVKVDNFFYTNEDVDDSNDINNFISMMSHHCHDTARVIAADTAVPAIPCDGHAVSVSYTITDEVAALSLSNSNDSGGFKFALPSLLTAATIPTIRTPADSLLDYYRSNLLHSSHTSSGNGADTLLHSIDSIEDIVTDNFEDDVTVEDYDVDSGDNLNDDGTSDDDTPSNFRCNSSTIVRPIDANINDRSYDEVIDF